MTAEDTAQTLRAGGMVPLGAAIASGEAVDRVVVRAYHHPVLPGRTVVRLTTEGVAIGDDLEMATLGFGPGADRGPVGLERKRALGFPGWALVHDPNNARHALDVVKELKAQARKARSRPGNAKDGIEAIAARLARTVPQFLPSFFEEAARAFLEHGAPGYAAVMFGKAREAEAVHALAVDEQHRLDGFLEFALAGAVSTRALTDYARQLAEHQEPAAAFAHFRRLCVQRTLGGMPPWAQMAKDLRRLARAARLDPDEEDAKVIAEIIESPALARAAGDFWRAYQAPITAVGKRSPAARGALLNLFPTGSTSGAHLDEVWLELLEACGALDALFGEAPEAARPIGGRAAWFNRLTRQLSGSWHESSAGSRVCDVLRRMAPRLVEDGAPIAAGRPPWIDLDLAELALELGVAVESVAHARIDIADWIKRTSGPDFGRDPRRVAAHPRLGPLLAAATAARIGDVAFDALSRGKAGFLAAKRAWLEALLARAEAGALPAVTEVLDVIGDRAGAQTFRELPDLHPRLAAIDVAAALLRTLQIGLLDEFGWPAVEDAERELASVGKTAVTLHGGLPAVVLASATRAIAVGPAGRLAVHDLVIPPRHELITLRYIGGQFLVVLKAGWKVHGYWSGAPRDVFETEVSQWWVPQIAVRAAVLSDGAWQEGKTPIRVGDHAVPQAGLLCHDGTTAWIGEAKDARPRMREVSASGEPGRISWPVWLEAGLAPEWQIDAALSYVLPAPDGLAHSPLGCRDGMLGARAAVRAADRATDRATDHQATARELTTIDGRRWTGSGALAVAELIELPSGESRPVVEERGNRHARQHGVTTAWLSRDGAVCGAKFGAGEPRYWRGSVAPYPHALWHALVGRDARGSRRLRAITDADARGLLAATEAVAADAVPVGVVGVVAARLPEITHERLRIGVAGVVALAAELVRKRDRLRDQRAPGKAKEHVDQGPDDAALKAALGGWVDHQWGQGGALAQIARAGELFRASDRRDRVELDATTAQLEWLPLAVVPGALAALATAIGVPDEQRQAIAALVVHLVRALPDPAVLRWWSGARTVADLGSDEAQSPLVLRWHDGNGYVIARQRYSGNQVHVLEYAPDGVFKPLPRITLGKELRGTAPVPAAAVAAARAGYARWSLGDAPALAAATGLTASEAVFLLAGCPCANVGGNNFLPKERREPLGLKAAQAAVARDALNAVPRAVRLAVLDEVGRGGDLAAAWNRIIGRRIAIAEDILAAADRELDAPIPPSQALAMFAAPADAPALTVDAHWGLDGGGDVIQIGESAPLVGEARLAGAPSAFSLAVLQAACAYLPFLYAALPVGDPLRAQTPIAHRLVLARLGNPSLLLEVGKGIPTLDRAGVDSVLASLGGEQHTAPAGYIYRIVDGAVIVRHLQVSATAEVVRLAIQLRPATLTPAAAADLTRLAAHVYSWGYPAPAAVAFMRSADLAAMMARIDDTPVPAGGWEQNPAASVPRLVERVARRLGAPADAAALYLQYLALLWPTPKNLTEWNGWTARQLAAANLELAGRGLILEAKRERAQRAYFLPGGWEALKPPHPPLESWKLALYGSRGAAGAVVPQMVRFAALAPFHLLFERAWQRIESGDVPRYDEVTR